jgi:hypothetical protein
MGALKMTAFAGRLMPVERVEVAVMTSMIPFQNPLSMISLSSPVSPE